MRIDNEPKLDYDDVLIRPKRSEAPSRSTIKLERKYRFLNSKTTWSGIPIVASNMDTTGSFEMAAALGPQMMTCIHKHYSNEDLLNFFGSEEHQACAFFTIGIGDGDFAKLREIKEHVPVQYVCVDVANGYTEYFIDRIMRLRQSYPKITIMAGNVATPEMVQELLITGAADIIKVGIGPGSVCTTRMKTGVGYPQLSAIIECADAAHGLKGHVCADGGCRTPGDIVKALAAGADFVMLGGMLAGHDECQAEWIEENGQRVAMKFYGMSSKTAMDKYTGGMKDYRAAEGTDSIILYKGPVSNTLQDICGGVRSACAYVGATSLKDLSKCTTFVRRA